MWNRFQWCTVEVTQETTLDFHCSKEVNQRVPLKTISFIADCTANCRSNGGHDCNLILTISFGCRMPWHFACLRKTYSHSWKNLIVVSPLWLNFCLYFTLCWQQSEYSMCIDLAVVLKKWLEVKFYGLEVCHNIFRKFIIIFWQKSNYKCINMKC